MTGAPPSSAAIPSPLDDDDDDVVWALQTAQVQWKRGAHADAVVWLRRAAESAMGTGHVERADDLNGFAAELTEKMLAEAPTEGAASDATEGAQEIDALIAPAHDRYSAPMPSIPIEVDLDVEINHAGSDADTERSMATADPVTTPPPIAARPGSPRDIGGQGSPIRPPPPPPRGPRPPPPRRQLPSFVTSAPTIDEMLGAQIVPADEQERPRPMPDARFPSPPPRPPSQPAPEPELGNVPTTLVAPPPDQDVSDSEASGPESDTVVAPLTAIDDLIPQGAGLKLSAPPESERAAPSVRPSSIPPRASSVPAPPSEASPSEAPPSEEAAIGGIVLANVRGLQDLPEDAQRALVQSARLETLAIEDEVSSFGIALVVDGWVTIMPTIADSACAHATKGAVVFTAGTLSEGIALRVVSGQDDTVVAVWDNDALEQATADCPWVADELRMVADRFQALAGVTMGAMGDRLDDALRAMVTDRCEVRALLPYEVLVEKGRPLPGLHVIGGGRVEIIIETAGGDGEVSDELGPGDFLFAPQVLSAAPAPATARAGRTGALVLFADRMTTHELLVSVPPLLELLAG